MSHKHTWKEVQEEELKFWLTPGAELGEQLKQIAYAKYLGLEFFHDGSSPWVINKEGKSIMDIGGGPVSLTLKTIASERVVVDPCKYPEWVDLRYHQSDIELIREPGEINYYKNHFEEIWLYNVLQHTQSPQKIFNNIYKSLKKGGVFRFFDWIDTAINEAHPITLTYDEIVAMLSKAGFKSIELKTDFVNENNAVGQAVYGTFTK